MINRTRDKFATEHYDQTISEVVNRTVALFEKRGAVGGLDFYIETLGTVRGWGRVPAAVAEVSDAPLSSLTGKWGWQMLRTEVCAERLAGTEVHPYGFDQKLWQNWMPHMVLDGAPVLDLADTEDAFFWTKVATPLYAHESWGARLVTPQEGSKPWGRYGVPRAHTWLTLNGTPTGALITL